MTNGSEQHKRIHTIFQFFLCHVDPKCGRVSQKIDKIVCAWFVLRVEDSHCV